MQQNGNLGFDLLTTAPVGPIDAQKALVGLASFDFVGVVKTTVMETAAVDCSKRI
jgi:hypothetical protein